MKYWNLFFIVVLVVAIHCSLAGQVQTGIPPYSTVGGGLNDAIDVGNLNVHFNFPIMQRPGRGIPLQYAYSYDSSIWYQVLSGGVYYWVPASNIGWQSINSLETGYLAYTETSSRCANYEYAFTYNRFVYVDPSGTRHPLTGSASDRSDCGGSITDAGGTATDGSGYSYHYGLSDNTMWVKTRGGTTIVPFATVTDRNGNVVTVSGSDSTGYKLVDTIASSDSPALTTSSTSANPRTFSYQGPSGQVQVQVHYSNYSVQTAFACTGVREYGPVSTSLPDKITYPDGSYYTITYEQTPGFASAVTGRIASLRLPTGGTITYQYTGGHNGIYCNDSTTPILKRTTPDGLWTYSRIQNGGSSTYTTTTVVDPSNSQSVINFVTDANGNSYETSRQEFQGSSTLLRTVQTCYNGSSAPCDQTTVTIPISRRTTTTTLPGISASKVDTFYNSIGSVTENDEYDFGASSPTRKTVISYAALGNNILDMPASVTIEDGSGTPVAQATYSYDENSVTATSGTPNLTSVNGSRGNVTTISQMTQGTGVVKQNVYYYDTGNIQKRVDNLGNATTYSYTACGNSLLGGVSLPLSLSRSISWNCAGPAVASVTDENNQATTYTYGDASAWRATQVSFPDGGQTVTQYGTGASTPWTVNSTALISQSQSVSTTSTLDGIGRVVQGQVTSDPDGSSEVERGYGYNSVGYLSSASNPYRSPAEITYGITSTQSDALGRVVQISRPDGNTALASYSGNCVTNSDEAGKQKKQCMDALGRVTAVYEPDDTNALNWETDYQYDLLNNLTKVTQKGGSANASNWRVRNFSYDGLSRLIQESTPEAGTITYSYDGCSGNPAQVCSRRDARSITTYYSYDALYRLISKVYSDSTPPVSYFYDQSSFAGLQTIANGKGRRTGMTDGSGSTAWSYDVMGRVVSRSQTISGVTKNIGYAFNLDGSIASITYPSGRVVSYAYNSAGQPVSATDSTAGTKYVSDAHYNAAGMLTTMNLGVVSGVSAVSVTNSFNNRLQVTRQQAASPTASTLMDLSYLYSQSSPTVINNNGNVLAVINNKSNSRSASYSYDQLNRLISAQTTSTWGDAYVYDPWGNLLQKNVTVGSAENLSVSVNAMNQITGLTYDASGNLKSDTFNTLNFNAESVATSGNEVAYTYDGDGKRVQKNSDTNSIYWVDDSYAPLAVSDACGNIKTDFVFFAGMRVAAVTLADGNSYYYLANNVGSTSVITNNDGSQVVWEADYYPFGGKQIITNNFDNSYLFTGYENDSETGYNYAVNRLQSPNWGRFMSPDPISGSISDPQSWNRYGYVRNNPLNSVDPLGLKRTAFDGGNGGDLDLGRGAYISANTTSGELGMGSTIDGLDAPTSAAAGLLGSGAISSGRICSGSSCGLVRTDPDTGDLETVIGWQFRTALQLDGSTQLREVPIWGDYDPLLLAQGPNVGAKQLYAVPANNGTTPSSPTTTQKVLTQAEKFICKSSPSARILTSMRNGAAVGAIRGGASGFVGGEIVEPLGGGLPGAALGAFLGGVGGGAGGVFKGAAMAWGCSLAGAY